MRIQKVVRIQTSRCRIVDYWRSPADGVSIDYETVHPYQKPLTRNMAKYANISYMDIHW